MKGWRGLIERSISHLRETTGSKQRVVILGPANSGKSTLYNQLVRSRTDRNPVSAIPGTTRTARSADAGLFAIVDTPGADAAGPSGQEERERAFGAAMQADMIVLLFDATHGIRGPEQMLYAEMAGLGKPLVVALNKMDLVRGERSAILAQAATALGLTTSEIIPVSAKNAYGLERLLTAIASREPAIVAALGAALPEYRWALSKTVIGRAASTAAAIAITPLPFLDFIPLVAVQSMMVLSIARVYSFKITVGRARELLFSLGLGFIGRTLFYELSKLGGPPGWLVAAGVASGVTVAMGYAVARWFESGTKVPLRSLRKISQDVGKEVASGVRVKGVPTRDRVREQVDTVLGDLPGLEDPSPAQSQR
jgi:small GTP-binding protein